ncbi:MAG: RraA family protein [Thermoleophilia bacterium]|nr:RraA family protein [Thermoleophilia bacterium]
MTDPTVADLARRFSALYTGVVADSLDRLGCMHQTLPSSLNPLRPGMRLAGPAFTVEGRPQTGKDHDAVVRRIVTMFGSVPPGYVAVYKTNDSTAAQLGELSATSLKARGCAGAVIDGGVRDVDFILREDFPVFCRYTTPQDGPPRWEVVDWDVVVTVGGVRIAPGDWVVGDLDGVVVVPGEAVADVLAGAEEKAGTENEIRDAVRAGMLPIEAYDRYGTF